MTTYTLQGYTTTFDASDNITSITYGATIKIVASDDLQVQFTPTPWAHDDYFEVYLQAAVGRMWSSTLNGSVLDQQTDVVAASLSTSSGQKVHFLDMYDNNLNVGNIFFIGGGVPSYISDGTLTLAQTAAFESTVTSQEALNTAPFTPGTPFALTEVAGMQVSENDSFMLPGDEIDTQFIASRGNDTIDVSNQPQEGEISYEHANMTKGINANMITGVVTGEWLGEAFTDTIVGGGFGVIGTALDDVIIVGAGNEVDDYILNGARGGLGNDLLIGNRLGGERDLYGDGGDDVIYADGYTGAFSDWSDDVFRLYQATLARAPDVAGHGGWVQVLESGDQSLSQAAAGFVGSAEFQATYGGLDDTGFVELMYQNVLGRAGDAAGVQGWVNQMTGGATEADVVVGFAQSGEFINNTAAQAASFAHNSFGQNWTDEVFRLYQATLGRAPDDAGLAGWSEILAGGRDYLEVAAGFVGSAEFEAAYGAGLSNGDFVTLLYQNVLNRAPDAAGLQGWINFMDNGNERTDVVRGFAESGEFVTNTRGDFLTFMHADERISDSTYANTDLIFGGAGDDFLVGGLGIDAFFFSASESGNDTVADYELWDVLAFDEFGYSTGAEARDHMSQQGADVVFSDQGASFTLNNVQLSEITDDRLLLWADVV